MLIGIGGDAAALDEDMLDVSFDRWLAGEDLPVTQLAGTVGRHVEAGRMAAAAQEKTGVTPTLLRVMAGLDPAIHVFWARSRKGDVDHRVKPGDDDGVHL